MEKVKLAGLAVGARKRLDEAFPEEDASAADRAERRQSLVYALARLRPLASALLWKIPRATLSDYLRELTLIRTVFADDKEALVLIRIQHELCRRFLESPHGLEPGLLPLLHKSLAALEALAADPQPSAQRARVVERLRAEFIRPKPSAPPGRTNAEAAAAGYRGFAPAGPAPAAEPRSGGAPLENRAYYLIPVEALEDLKKHIRSEVEQLETRLLRALRIR